MCTHQWSTANIMQQRYIIEHVLTARALIQGEETHLTVIIFWSIFKFYDKTTIFKEIKIINIDYYGRVIGENPKFYDKMQAI